MKGKVFQGVATALVTPFKDGTIDYCSLEVMIHRQLDANIDALVFSGTTGEAPTLSEKEKSDLFRFAVREVGGRADVICGTASNSHEKSMQMSYAAADAGADALLCVTPYYNKGTWDGVVRCYREICSIGVPVILYNIPSRTGIDVRSDILGRLYDEPMLAGVKECAGSDRILENKLKFGGRFSLYTGNDAELLASFSVGADGVISVLSNIYPEQVKSIYELCSRGQMKEARDIYSRVCDMISLLFEQTNPAPVKYALSTLGLCENSLRLPMSEINGELCRKIDKEMKKIEQSI